MSETPCTTPGCPYGLGHTVECGTIADTQPSRLLEVTLRDVRERARAADLAICSAIGLNTTHSPGLAIIELSKAEDRIHEALLVIGRAKRALSQPIESRASRAEVAR